jgi:NH3-dependent NAD+ synthetase
MTDETGQARIERAGVSFSGGVDPTVARAAAERAFTSLAATGLPGRGHLADLRVDVRVPQGSEQHMAEAIAAAVAAAIRREAGR